MAENSSFPDPMSDLSARWNWDTAREVHAAIEIRIMPSELPKQIRAGLAFVSLWIFLLQRAQEISIEISGFSFVQILLGHSHEEGIVVAKVVPAAEICGYSTGISAR